MFPCSRHNFSCVSFFPESIFQLGTPYALKYQAGLFFFWRVPSFILVPTSNISHVHATGSFFKPPDFKFSPVMKNLAYFPFTSRREVQYYYLKPGH